MAYKKNNRRRKSKRSRLERLAYDMGRVQSGLGKDTKVNDSYKRGQQKPEKKAKKPLY